jgi:hypothetical protein
VTDQQQTDGFVYVDTETTGLDRRRHHAYELSWAVDRGPIHTLLLPHSLRYADPKALEVGGYYSRGIPGKLRMQQRHERPAFCNLADFVAAFTAPDGSKRTLVAANPAFDAGMLFGKVIGREPWSTRWRRRLCLPAPPAPVEPWHYRMLDIEAYAAGVFGWTQPLGMTKLRDQFTARGYIIPEPDHTAAGDVAALRAMHYACWNWLGPWGPDVPRTDRAVDPA